MSKFVVRQECSYVKDGAAVHHSKRVAGLVIDIDDAEAAPLVESGCLEPVAKTVAAPQDPEPEADTPEADTEPDAEVPARRRRGRIHDDG